MKENNGMTLKGETRIDTNEKTADMYHSNLFHVFPLPVEPSRWFRK